MGWLEERYLPARMGERYRQMMGAISANGGNGRGAGAAPTQAQGKLVNR